MAYKLETITKKLIQKTNKAEARPVYTFKLSGEGTKITVTTEREMFKTSDIGKDVLVE